MRAAASQNAEMLVAPKLKYSRLYDTSAKTRCPGEFAE